MRNNCKKGFVTLICLLLCFENAFLPAQCIEAEVVSENSVAADSEIVSDNSTYEDQEIEPQGETNDDSGDNQKTDSDDLGKTENESDSKESEVKKPDTVKLISVTASDYQTIEISFEKGNRVDGYELLRSEESPNNMNVIASLDKAVTSYTDSAENGVKTGKTYYYKVRAYVLNEKKEKVYSDDSQVLSAFSMLDLPELLSINPVNYKSQKVIFQKVTGADGYEIYRSTKRGSGYKKLASVKATKLFYTDKKCVTGTKYYYKIRAFRKIDGQNVYSEYSNIKAEKAVPIAPQLVSATAINADTLSISWKKVKGASGYKVYRSTSKKGKYQAIYTANSMSEVTAMIAGQENGFDYYYKVKAFCKKGKKLIYGKESKVKKVAFKYYTYANESYQAKAKRVFGTQYYNKYPNKAIAEQHMTTITVAVWDIAPRGGKVTKLRTLTVNAAIAPSVQKIFQEIYEGAEQFPIKSVGGYSWRGDNSYSEHCDGLAIDINPNENYMIEGNGTISSGSFWLPGTNAYSIPANGEVVKIFRKYGFGWGGDGWSSGRHDYMHFSYFGG